MPKYVTGVTQVPQSGIHKWATVDEEGAARPTADMPPAEQVELQMEDGPEDPGFVIPHASNGEFAGDIWHEDLHAAFE